MIKRIVRNRGLWVSMGGCSALAIGVAFCLAYVIDDVDVELVRNCLQCLPA